MSAMPHGDEMDNSDQHMRQMTAFIKKFWREQGALRRPARQPEHEKRAPPAGREMDDLEITSEQSFKTHNDLPLARIKRIMKSDEDVRMISVRARGVAAVRARARRRMTAAIVGGGAGALRQGLRALHPRTDAPVLVLQRAVEARRRRPAPSAFFFSSRPPGPRRKTLQKEDITAAIHKTENFDFLVDSVGRPSVPPP